MNNYTDEELVTRAREGSIEAFEALFDRYKKPVLNFVYRFLGNLETAEDVVQEAFLKAYKNLDIFDTTKKFTSWLYTIARNLAKNAIRDKKYFHDLPLDKAVDDSKDSVSLKELISDESMRPDLIAQHKELQDKAEAVLLSLPPECREVITLCSIQNMALKDAAEILDCSIATVSVRLMKGKQLFLKKLGLNP